MNTFSARHFPLALLSAALLTFCAAAASAQSTESLEQMSKDPNQWVMPGGNYSVTRYSALDQINASNVKDLHVAWTMSTGTLRGQEGQPLVVGNMMYFESSYPNYVYAVDLNNVGKIVWKSNISQDAFAETVACCDVVNRGVAYADGMIFANLLDGRIYAFDAKTGAVKWSARNADPKIGQTMTMAPLVIHDEVLTGVSGAEYGVRGYLTAYNIHTGKQMWRAYSEGPDTDLMFNPDKTLNGATGKPVGKDSSLKTWKGDQWKLGGGTTWGWYSYDPKLNLVYYGTGNPGTWNPTARPGDNAWSMSIIARNPDTGEAAWAYQMTPHDGWDYDGVNESILTETEVNGKEVPTLTHFDRNGYAYVLNRANGHLIAAHSFIPDLNWSSKIDLKTGRPVVNPAKMTKEGVNVKDICPGSQGGKDQQPAAYDPNTRLFYTGTNLICEDYQAFAAKYKAGFPYVGAIVRMYRPTNAPWNGQVGGRFIAYDPMTGKTKWAIDDQYQDWSGTLTTKGGIAFYGTMTGWFRAVDLNTGKILWQFKAPSGIIGNPIAYMHNGKQYIAILSGVGGWGAIGLSNGLTKATAGLGAVNATAQLGEFTNLGGTLFVFALGNNDIPDGNMPAQRGVAAAQSPAITGAKAESVAENTTH
ncbi:MAG: Methanol dehydrogenase large subunit protein [Rhodanobacteraceae bacterium]|jgi:PQQ-dependent dehydrogenase (methanol/ethanol family)|nr:MAG: Methanol dehydrogenase large subunit protein [Rhodanobacteraceae bacterium]